jgi:TRAP-type mannitol/chloroaromatic compound transport system permease large subunit
VGDAHRIGALGAVATVLMAAIYRALTCDGLLKALMGTAAISGVILFIIVGATTFSQILTFSEPPMAWCPRCRAPASAPPLCSPS